MAHNPRHKVSSEAPVSDIAVAAGLPDAVALAAAVVPAALFFVGVHAGGSGEWKSSRIMRPSVSSRSPQSSPPPASNSLR